MPKRYLTLKVIIIKIHLHSGKVSSGALKKYIFFSSTYLWKRQLSDRLHKRLGKNQTPSGRKLILF